MALPDLNGYMLVYHVYITMAMQLCSCDSASSSSSWSSSFVSLLRHSETERSLSEYLLFHYGSDKELLSWSETVGAPKDCTSFPADLSRVAINFVRQRQGPPKFGRALDIGCAVGRTYVRRVRCGEQRVFGPDLHTLVTHTHTHNGHNYHHVSWLCFEFSWFQCHVP
jgi:hypothetical protein